MHNYHLKKIAQMKREDFWKSEMFENKKMKSLQLCERTVRSLI